MVENEAPVQGYYRMMSKTKARLVKRWIAAFCLLGFISAWPPPAEAAKIQYLFKAWNGPSLRVFVTRPVGLAPDRPVVFVMHGSERDAVGYRDQWHELANKYDFLLVVPEFRDRQFPGSESYSLGNVFDDQGRAREESGWSYAAIEAIFDDLHSRFGVSAETYSMYGHSEGAEFVQRYVLHVPQTRGHRFVAADAGQYMMPDFEEPFPYGLKRSVVDDTRLAGALRLPLVVLLEAHDTHSNDADLVEAPEAMVPGPIRLARGEAFFAKGREASERLGVPFNWSLERVEGAGNDSRFMAPAAIPFLLNW